MLIKDFYLMPITELLQVVTSYVALHLHIVVIFDFEEPDLRL